MFENRELIEILPQLGKFAWRLTKNTEQAEDLVQDTVLRMLEKKEYFQQGTNLFSWGGKVMFNLFVSGYRRRAKFETQYDPEPYIAALVQPATQENALYCKQIVAQLKQLTGNMEATVNAVVSSGSYEAASEILGIPIGTVRSRMNRARANLDDGVTRLRIAREGDAPHG